MKVLIATRATQGSVTGDYCWTIDGELVTPLVLECCSPSTCGCGRGFPGLASARATTTAEVADLAHLDDVGLREAVRDSLERTGWLRGLDRDDADELVGEHIAEMRAVCTSFPVGAVVRRSGGRVWSVATAA